MPMKSKKGRYGSIGLALTVITALVIFLVSAGISGKARHKKDEPTLTIGERFQKETSMSWRGVMGDLFRSRPQSQVA